VGADEKSLTLRFIVVRRICPVNVSVTVNGPSRFIRRLEFINNEHLNFDPFQNGPKMRSYWKLLF
jgi:hypothetical protein